MISQEEILCRLRERRDSQHKWLADETPYTFSDQKHLNANTPERAYWHHGYYSALNDVIRLFEQGINQKADSTDTSN